jgi:hypothetical protein
VSAELEPANVNICANVAEALERAKKLWSLRNEQEAEPGVWGEGVPLLKS